MQFYFMSEFFPTTTAITAQCNSGKRSYLLLIIYVFFSHVLIYLCALWFTKFQKQQTVFVLLVCVRFKFKLT